MSPKISDVEKEKRRLLIIESATEVFKRKGYESSTMQDIVDQTGMSRGWVYIYFSSKEEMMHAILEENDRQAQLQFKKLLNSDASVWQGLLELFEAVNQELDDESDTLPIAIYEYFISGWREPERRSFLQKHYIDQHETLHRYLQKGVDNGEFKPVADLDVIIKMITSYFEGLLMHTKAAGSQNVRVKEQLHFFTMVLQDLLRVQK